MITQFYGSEIPNIKNIYIIKSEEKITVKKLALKIKLFQTWCTFNLLPQLVPQNMEGEELIY